MIKCKTICRNFVYTKLFILFIGYKNNPKYFHFFSIVKMATRYAEIGRVGKREAGFQQVPPFQISEFSLYCYVTSII